MNLHDRIWEFLLRDTLKPLAVFLASFLHLLFLIGAWIALAGVRDFGRLEEYVRRWEPIKPDVFEFEEHDA